MPKILDIIQWLLIIFIICLAVVYSSLWAHEWSMLYYIPISINKQYQLGTQPKYWSQYACIEKREYCIPKHKVMSVKMLGGIKQLFWLTEGSHVALKHSKHVTLYSENRAAIVRNLNLYTMIYFSLQPICLQLLKNRDPILFFDFVIKKQRTVDLLWRESTIQSLFSYLNYHLSYTDHK